MFTSPSQQVLLATLSKLSILTSIVFMHRLLLWLCLLVAFLKLVQSNTKDGAISSEGNTYCNNWHNSYITGHLFHTDSLLLTSPYLLISMSQTLYSSKYESGNKGVCG